VNGGEPPVPIRAVVFGIGETLLDDSREFGAWADWIGVPRHTFAHVIGVAPGEPHQIVYVGDHRDNDLVPAKAAGLRTTHIRRGPWGYLWAEDPKVLELAGWRIGSLAELPALIEAAQG